jgi:hypothetical protein
MKRCLGILFATLLMAAPAFAQSAVVINPAPVPTCVATNTLVFNGTTWECGSAGAGSGTVTSVAATVPTGLSIAGSPITTAGTLAFTLTSGYMIPGGGTSGQVLRSQGASAPAFSTATYPATSGSAGCFLRGDGTNYACSTLILPNAATSGDLLVASGANTIGAQAPAALTKSDDTNVTLTLGGSASTALVNAASLTLGWSGQLGLTRGGTNASLTAANGGIVYSTATAMAILAAGSSGQIIRSGGAGAPSWSTATYPATAGTAGAYLRADGTNVILSTLILPNAATANRIVYATSANTYGENAGLTFSPSGAGAFGVTGLATITSDSGSPHLNLVFDGSNSGGIGVTSLGAMEFTATGTTPVFRFTSTAADQFGVHYDGKNFLKVNVSSAGAVTLNAEGASAGFTFSDLATFSGGAAIASMSNGGIVYSTATQMAVLAAGSSGQIVRSGGAGAPSWSTATYPATAGSAGTFMRSDGTNFSGSTLVLPNAATAGDLLYASGSNTYASTTRKAAGLAYTLSTSYVDGTGTAGTDNTAMTVKSVNIDADTLTQVGDRVHISVKYKTDTGTALAPTMTVNGVTTVAVTATATDASVHTMETWLSYIDSTHANVTSWWRAANGAVAQEVTNSGSNVASFAWGSVQAVNIVQNAIANNRIIVTEIVMTVYPKGV